MMNKLHRTITLSSYLALACAGVPMTTGCQRSGEDHGKAAPATIEIRFQDSDVAQQSSSAGVLRVAPLVAAPATQAAGPTTRDEVARILVDIHFGDSGQPFFLNFDLTEIAPDVWRGDVPLLPRNQQLRFRARALNAAGEVAFSGETLAILTIDHQSLSIPLAPAQDNHTFQIPRMFRIVYPAEIFAGQEEQIAFTIQGNAGAALGIRITPADSDAPAAEFSPATGTVTLASMVADFVAVYTAPEVTADTAFDYQVTITDARAQGAVAITTGFRTTVKPRPPGAEIVTGTRPSVLFNPVILSLTANGSETPGTVALFAAASDDGAPDQLAYQWSYAPDTGTADATFTNAGLGNPGMFEGYTVAHQGTLTLAVTDEDNGTTTLHYQLAPGQFADAIDHDSVKDLRRIVAGHAHTCVLTGEDRVRCWGDNQFGQLGYGTAIDVGDAPNTLPFTAGEVPLPESDPVVQLVAGNHHTCALLHSGFVSCWGDNRFGQLGHGRTDNLGDDEAVTAFGFVTLDELASRIAAGGDHTCAILRSGALTCWGLNDFGQLGRGHTANLGDNEPLHSAGHVDLGAGVTVRDVALGDLHTCALLTTGAVRCWGRNTEGQLGYGHSQHLGDNEQVNNLPDVSLGGTVRKLVAGGTHTCALTFEGTLRCWGRNTAGQLGQSYPGFAGVGVASGNPFWGDNANEDPSSLPGDVNTGAPVTDVAAGDGHTCALSSDGQLRCWGEGIHGQLGYGDFTNRLTPRVDGVRLDDVTAYRITAGAAHTCALRHNITARCWGLGADGRLGRGSTATSATAMGDVDVQIFPLRCGDGIRDPGEQCDDGNAVNGDACDHNCTFPRCGNRIIDPGERCDDGNSSDGDDCEDSCTMLRFAFRTAGTFLFEVPEACAQLSVKMWGAGGGGSGGLGGGGGFTAGRVGVTPGETVTLVVGEGGRDRSNGSGDGGGGTALLRSGTPLLVAGGGGGGGSSAGGAGGGATGQTGTAFSSSGIASGGLGGTQVAPGAGGSGSRRTGFSGSGRDGGHGSNTCGGAGTGGGGAGFGNGGLGYVYCGDGGAGGGGGGWFGGGGGGGNDGGAGGGGGSGHVASSPTVTGASTVSGSGSQPGNPADADRQGAGTGGVFLGPGQNGAVILRCQG